VLALFAVILLHTSSLLLMDFKKSPLSDWFAGDVYNALSRFAVPVFVMITGALLLRREYELSDFLKRRFTRVLWPFLIWSLVYVAYLWYDEEMAFKDDLWGNIPIVWHLLRNGAYYHLWYVYMLVGLYLIIPIIGKFVRNATEKEILYFLLVWFIVIAFSQPYLSDFLPQVDVRYFSGYIGYLVLGHYLASKKLPEVRNKTGLVIFYLLCVVSIILGTYFITNATKSISTIMYEPLGPFVILYSAGVFLLARVIVFRVPKRLVGLRDLIGNLSLGMYLCHALFLSRLDDWGISYKLCNPFISIPLTALVCFILSFILMFILSKIPVVGKYIAG
jgi:surface polysaccharide O-acyltransferase-like enzyme